MLTVSPNEAKNLLTDLSPGDRIGFKKLSTGEVQVLAADAMTKTKDQIIQEKYSSLAGQPITASEAADKYDVHRRTIFKWIDKGYLTVLEPEPVMQVDEAEVAYCVDVYKERRDKIPKGVPLLGEDGLPYQLKHPQLSAYRRRKKQL